MNKKHFNMYDLEDEPVKKNYSSKKNKSRKPKHIMDGYIKQESLEEEKTQENMCETEYVPSSDPIDYDALHQQTLSSEEISKYWKEVIITPQEFTMNPPPTINKTNNTQQKTYEEMINDLYDARDRSNNRLNYAPPKKTQTTQTYQNPPSNTAKENIDSVLSGLSQAKKDLENMIDKVVTDVDHFMYKLTEPFL